MVIGFTSLVRFVIGFVVLLAAAVVYGVAALKCFRQKDKYGMWQGVFGAFGFGLLPCSFFLGPFQALVVLMIVAASMMGLRGHMG